jgi:flavin-dependent dehydrogenase
VNDVDVLIWGSGITGSRLALSLAEAGVSVAVIPRGPASYPVFPGVGDADGAIQERSELESDLLNNAARSGVTILTEETVTSFSPVSGPIRSVLTEHQAIDVRCVVFADGADPRVGRARGLLPDWEPWQLVHFAWQRVDGAASGFQAIAGKRGEWPWRGYLAGTSQGSWIGVGWNLQCEMDSHIHVTELLADVRGSFPGVGELVGEPQVEVVPYEPRHLEGAFCAENVVAVGDLTGIVNPLSLRRVEISLKIADSASRLIDQALKQGDPIRFESEMVRTMLRPFVNGEMQRDSGPPMPPIPRPASRVGSLIQRMIDRKQR